MFNEQRMAENNLARHDGRVEMIITLHHMILAGEKITEKKLGEVLIREEHDRDVARNYWEKNYLYK